MVQRLQLMSYSRNFQQQSTYDRSKCHEFVVIQDGARRPTHLYSTSELKLELGAIIIEHIAEHHGMTLRHCYDLVSYGSNFLQNASPSAMLENIPGDL